MNSLRQKMSCKRGSSRAILLLLILLFLSFFLNILTPRPKVTVRRLKDGNYQLRVEGKPYLVKGVCYSPIPIGKNYEYDFWADNLQPWKIDGRLMKNMGVNTVRFYQPGSDPEAVKRVIRDFYNLYSIRTIMGHWLGFWEEPYPDYGNPLFRERIKNEVIQMVKTYKDEPGIISWVLGNENNFSFGPQKVNPWTTPEIEKIKDPYEQRRAKAKLYYSLVNKVAKEIKRIDRRHLVAFGNGETDGIELAREECPDVDLLGVATYRGKSFGSLFRDISQKWGRPFILIEFGSDRYDAKLSREDEDTQATFLKSQWVEIERNSFQGSGEGNCLGGCVFEWIDEWWKFEEYNSVGWYIHNTEASWSNGSYYYDIGAPRNMNMNEEWWGIVAINPEKEKGMDKRSPRKAYYLLKEMWNTAGRIEGRRD